MSLGGESLELFSLFKNISRFGEKASLLGAPFRAAGQCSKNFILKVDEKAS